MLTLSVYQGFIQDPEHVKTFPKIWLKAIKVFLHKSFIIDIQQASKYPL